MGSYGIVDKVKSQGVSRTKREKKNAGVRPNLKNSLSEDGRETKRKVTKMDKENGWFENRRRRKSQNNPKKGVARQGLCLKEKIGSVADHEGKPNKLKGEAGGGPCRTYHPGKKREKIQRMRPKMKKGLQLGERLVGKESCKSKAY